MRPVSELVPLFQVNNKIFVRLFVDEPPIAEEIDGCEKTCEALLEEVRNAYAENSKLVDAVQMGNVPDKPIIVKAVSGLTISVKE